MPKRQLSFGLGAMFVFAASLAAVFAADDHDHPHPKHSLKQVMLEANKDKDGEKSLLKKVIGGNASDAEKIKLLDYYISMVESKPKKGEMDSWHNLAGRAVTAAAKVAVGREGAEEELKASTNCKACHSKHKPS
jgi:hypothetical protein